MAAVEEVPCCKHKHDSTREMDTARSKKKDKVLKKLFKIKRNLSDKEGIEICESPSKILCIQNGGLGNDVSQEDLLPLLSPFGDIDDIIMIPRKQFCFVCFTSEACSQEVLTRLNGHVLRKGADPSQDVILYFMNVSKAPSNVTPSGDKPPGLHIVDNFIDEDREKELVQFVENYMESMEVTGQMKHRKVLHFGYEFKYDINDVDVNDPLPSGIPDICQPFLKKAHNLGLVNHLPDQLTINQYLPGQGIPPHIDTPPAFEDGIMSLSIGSQAVMDFRHAEQGKHLAILLPRRSLLVMTGESRYRWSHGITPRKSDIISAGEGKGLTLLQRGTRTSFTFRKVIKDRGNAPKNDLNSQALPQTEAEAIALERVHVHEVYDDIADHFSGTRYKPWPRVVEFLLEQPSYSFLADVGCGNGKCLGVNKNLFEIGCDYSSNLISICNSRGFQTCVADVTCLPFRSEIFDVVLSIAVIHHMATRERRIRAISEVIRLLRVGGKALIYVWAMEQNLNKSPSKYIKCNRQKQLHEEGRELSTEVLNAKEISPTPSIDSSKPLVDVITTRRKENTHRSLCSNNSSNLSDLKTSNDAISEEGTSDACDIEADCAMHTSADGEDHSQTHSCEENQPKKSLPVHVNRTQFQEQDMLVPWKLKGQKVSGVGDSKDSLSSDTDCTGDPQLFHRYYHVFRQGEIEALCKRVPNCVVRKSYYDQGNWCVVLEKH